MFISQLKKSIRNTTFKHITLVILLGFPIIFPIRSLIAGTIPHWHDTSRELLLGLENLEKIRLIGNSGGIPGIFYGPHWIWLISIVQLVSKDPVVIAAIVLLIPYFVFIPYVLYKFKPLFGSTTVALLWLLFILKYYPNAVHLWHIYLTPAAFLTLIYLLITIDWNKHARTTLLAVATTGFLASFLMFTHMSFGAMIAIATFLYVSGNIAVYLYKNYRKGKEIILHAAYIFASFSGGFIISSLPFIVFEIRHGFNQTKTIIHVLTQSFLYNSAVVGQVGLNPTDIAKTFLKIPVEILGLSGQFIISVWLAILFVGLFLTIKKRWQLTTRQKRLMIFLGLVVSVALYVYFNSKNPIWIYHFTGMEIVFLLFFGLLAKKSQLIKVLLFVWVGYLSVSAIINFATVKPPDPLSLQTLYAKRHIVESIYQDADTASFSVHTYSSAIYTFDYDYLFKWLGSDVYAYEPNPDADLVYLIIPEADEAIQTDFINYKTPSDQFETESEWSIANGTVVVKRVRVDL